MWFFKLFRRRGKAVTSTAAPPTESANSLAEQKTSRLMLRMGVLPGAPHVRKGINRQDAVDSRVVELGGRTYTIGFLADGCSGENPKKSHTEVGAKLLVEYALGQVQLLLWQGVPMENINIDLYRRCVDYLRTIAAITYPGVTSTQAYLDFVSNYLMCTLVGFVTDGETKLVTFRCGDGVRIFNDDIQLVHEKAPMYVGYHVLMPNQLKSIARKAGVEFNLTNEFESETFAVPDLRRFAICSDGMTQKKPGGQPGEEYVSAGDIEGIFNNDPQAPAGLQWYLNKRAQLTPFADDVAVIELHRMSS